MMKGRTASTAPPPVTIGGPTPLQANAPPARILMVDDHPPNLVALDAILDPLGQDLVHAGSGEEALRHLLESDFALILMDVQMPGLDGLQTAKLIRSLPSDTHYKIRTDNTGAVFSFDPALADGAGMVAANANATYCDSAQ